MALNMLYEWLIISHSLKYACRTGFENVVQILLLSSLSFKKCDNRSTQDESIEIEIQESNTNNLQNQFNSATNNIQNALHDAIVDHQFLCFQEIVQDQFSITSCRYLATAIPSWS